MNNPIWSSLWHRAAKEPIGIAFKISNAWGSFFDQMMRTRPESFKDYTLCRTQDDTVFFITKPNAVIDDSIPD
jgi:hypothetical protein